MPFYKHCCPSLITMDDHTDACLSRQADDIQVTIHGAYGRGPMPVEFRDALVELARCVKQGVGDGTLGKKRQQQGAPDATT